MTQNALLSVCFLPLHFICVKVIHTIVSNNGEFIFIAAHNFI